MISRALQILAVGFVLGMALVAVLYSLALALLTFGGVK